MSPKSYSSLALLYIIIIMHSHLFQPPPALPMAMGAALRGAMTVRTARYILLIPIIGLAAGTRYVGRYGLRSTLLCSIPSCGNPIIGDGWTTWECDVISVSTSPQQQR